MIVKELNNSSKNTSVQIDSEKILQTVTLVGNSMKESFCVEEKTMKVFVKKGASMAPFCEKLKLPIEAEKLTEKFPACNDVKDFTPLITIKSAQDKQNKDFFEVFVGNQNVAGPNDFPVKQRSFQVYNEYPFNYFNVIANKIQKGVCGTKIAPLKKPEAPKVQITASNE